MSSESSASETTPLRRPESQNSEDVVLTSSQTPSSSSSVRPPVNRGSSTTTVSIERSTIALIRDDKKNKSNSNSNIVEVHLNGGSNNQNNNNNSQRQSEMDTNKRILCRIGLDVLILLCVGFPILYYYLWGVSYQRGFFCDDESLKHPFKESTVRNWMLYIIGLVIPIAVIFIVEIVKSKENARKTNGNSTTSRRRFVFKGYEIPDWLIECYKKIGVYAFGAAVGQLTTDIAKYSIGRLRPHFFTVCQPIMSDGTTCEDAKNAGRYITDFKCLGNGSTPRMLKEASLSFPSGHSSFTFYAMIYMSLYLQSRMTWKGSQLLRHALQFVFIMVAWYTALSRVSDYKHHWSDVLAGSLIGSLTALVVVNYVSDLFKSRQLKGYELPTTTQDLTHMPQRNGH